MRRGAEAVQAQAPHARAGRLEAAPADQAGAHQRRDARGRLVQQCEWQAEVGFGTTCGREPAVAVSR
jgi:hypothetical protein